MNPGEGPRACPFIVLPLHLEAHSLMRKEETLLIFKGTCPQEGTLHGLGRHKGSLANSKEPDGAWEPTP